MTRSPSRRILQLYHAILHDAKDSLEATDVQRMLDTEWDDLCILLGNTVGNPDATLALKSMVVPLHKVRQGSAQARADLFTFWKQNCHLQQVTLTSERAESTEDMHMICAALAQSTSLQTIELRRLRLADPSGWAFSPLQGAIKLHSIHMQHVHRSTEQSLLQVLTDLGNIRNCQLVGSGASANDDLTDNIHDTVAMISPHSQLNSLAVDRRSLSAQSLQSIANIARLSASIEALSIKLHGCGSFSQRDGQPSVQPDFLRTLGECAVPKLSLHKLNWSNVPASDLKCLLLNKSLADLMLEGVGDEQGRSILEASHNNQSLECLSLSLDWVSLETLRAAETCMLNNPSLAKLCLQGPLIPTLTWSRTEGKRGILCHANLSFGAVDWDILSAWMQSNHEKRPIRHSWSVQTMDEMVVLQLAYLLSGCRNLSQLDLFWSSRFSFAAAESFVSSMAQNESVSAIAIRDGVPITEKPAPMVAWLRQKCRGIEIRNHVNYLVRARVPAGVWPSALVGDESTIFHALKQGLVVNATI